MNSVDLVLRYCIIAIAWHLACAWEQTFQSSYPIIDAFELADTAEEQLFKSLGISLRSLYSSPSTRSLSHCAQGPTPSPVFALMGKMARRDNGDVAFCPDFAEVVSKDQWQASWTKSYVPVVLFF